jgi:hypothetical protein
VVAGGPVWTRCRRWRPPVWYLHPHRRQTRRVPPGRRRPTTEFIRQAAGPAFPVSCCAPPAISAPRRSLPWVGAGRVRGDAGPGGGGPVRSRRRPRLMRDTCRGCGRRVRFVRRGGRPADQIGLAAAPGRTVNATEGWPRGRQAPDPARGGRPAGSIVLVRQPGDRGVPCAPKGFAVHVRASAQAATWYLRAGRSSWTTGARTSGFGRRGTRFLARCRALVPGSAVRARWWGSWWGCARSRDGGPAGEARAGRRRPIGPAAYGSRRRRDGTLSWGCARRDHPFCASKFPPRTWRLLVAFTTALRPVCCQPTTPRPRGKRGDGRAETYSGAALRLLGLQAPRRRPGSRREGGSQRCARWLRGTMDGRQAPSPRVGARGGPVWPCRLSRRRPRSARTRTGRVPTDVTLNLHRPRRRQPARASGSSGWC